MVYVWYVLVLIVFENTWSLMLFLNRQVCNLRFHSKHVALRTCFLYSFTFLPCSLGVFPAPVPLVCSGSDVLTRHCRNQGDGGRCVWSEI
jgi:hypothetical protein